MNRYLLHNSQIILYSFSFLYSFLYPFLYPFSFSHRHRHEVSTVQPKAVLFLVVYA
jgi:hypothetical protein